MSSDSLKNQAKRLIRLHNELQLTSRDKQIYNRSHKLFLSASDTSLQAFILSVYEQLEKLELDTTRRKGTSPRQLAEEFITFHLPPGEGGLGRSTWNVNTFKDGTIELTAPSFNSFKTWKTDVMPRFFLGPTFNRKASKELEKISSDIISKPLHLGHSVGTEVAGVNARILEARARNFADGLFFASAIREIALRVSAQSGAEIAVTRRGQVNKRAQFKLTYETHTVSTGKDEGEMGREISKFLRSIAGEKTSRKFSTAILDVVEDILRWGRVKRTSLEKSRANITRVFREKVQGRSYSPTVKPVKESGNSTLDPATIREYLNAKLPVQVAVNMIQPALVYRTGRFASSAEVVDVRESKKDEGSFVVSYTYMRYPYQVFEMGSGSALATPDRDPRAIIGQSIREVAQEIAFTRFGLRRV